MNLNNLYYFYISAKNHSISKAGESLNITQSAVSRSIIGLENELGVKLLIRRKKGVELTDHGTRLYDLTRDFFLGYANLDNLFKENASNHLRVATTAGIATFWFPKIMKTLEEKMPELRLSIVTHTEDISLQQREADVIIGPRQSLNPDLHSVFFKKYNLKLYASKDYIKSYGVPKTKQDLLNHKVITFCTDSKNSVNHEDMFIEGLTEFEPFLRVNSSPALLELLRRGVGITLFGEDDIYDENIVEIKLPDLEIQEQSYYVSYLKTSSNQALIIKFEKSLLEIEKLSYTSSF